jgi:hypothetical protein
MIFVLSKKKTHDFCHKSSDFLWKQKLNFDLKCVISSLDLMLETINSNSFLKIYFLQKVLYLSVGASFLKNIFFIVNKQKIVFVRIIAISYYYSHHQQCLL